MPCSMSIVGPHLNDVAPSWQQSCVFKVLLCRCRNPPMLGWFPHSPVCTLFSCGHFHVFVKKQRMSSVMNVSGWYSSNFECLYPCWYDRALSFSTSHSAARQSHTFMLHRIAYFMYRSCSTLRTKCVYKHNVCVNSSSYGNVCKSYIPHAFHLLHFPLCHIFLQQQNICHGVWRDSSLLPPTTHTYSHVWGYYSVMFFNTLRNLLWVLWMSDKCSWVEWFVLF